MRLFWLLLNLPLILWHQGIETAPALKQAGLEQIAVPTEQADAWQKAGFKPVAMSSAELEHRQRLLAPRVAGRANIASATRRPWIDANGWRFTRNPTGKFYYDLPAGRAALAAAEAFAYGADAVLKIDPADLEEAGKMLAFLRSLPQDTWPPVADLAVVDDGAPELDEVLNLLARRNLLFRIVRESGSQFPVTIKLGTREFPTAEASDPSAFAQKIRRLIGDENRSLRIYGTEVVIGRFTVEGKRARVHLLNYSGREADGLRVRVRGIYGKGEARAFGHDRVTLADFVATGSATEFTLPRMGIYAMAELTAK
jgi:hypothetical protein